MSWRVRAATTDDIDVVAALARASWHDTYRGLLLPETIEAFLDQAYSRDRLQSRITSDHFYVAEGPHGIVAFADAVEDLGQLQLTAIYALPQLRGQGAGTALVDALTAHFPDLPIAADVLVANREGETFYEHRGFEARETVERQLFGERVVERRWWRAPRLPSRPTDLQHWGSTPADCPICQRGHPDDVAVELGGAWITIPPMTPLPGYVCLVAKRHVREPFELPDEERRAFWDDLDRVAAALVANLHPRKLNYEIHGNVLPHLHVHVFPRWPGDRFEGRPIDATEAVPRTDKDRAAIIRALENLPPSN